MSQWYFSDAGQQRGPISKDELMAKLAAGTLEPGALIWSEGMTDWKPASSLAELQAPAPPPAAAPTVPRPVESDSPYAPPTALPAGDVDWSSYTPSGPQVRPWIRYWARSFDYLFFCLVAGGILSAVFPDFGEMNDTLFGVVLLFGYAFFEPMMLASLGTTPFKALLCVRVRNTDGSKLTYLQGLRRSFSVWVFGQGLGIPLVTLITNIAAHSRLTKNGITSWDQAGNFTVSHQTVAWWRWVLMVGTLVGFGALMALGAEA
jgi:hypothetical protein